MHSRWLRHISKSCLVATMAGVPVAAMAAKVEPSVRTPVIRRPTVNVRLGRLATVKFDAATPSWSPDGKQIAFIEAKDGPRVGNLWIATTAGALKRITSAGVDGMPCWTVDGRLVVARVSGKTFSLQVVNTASGRVAPLVSGRTFPAGGDKVPSSIAFAPDGSKVALDMCKTGETLDESGRIVVMDLKSGKVEDLKTPAKSVVSHPSWSPDGRYIAYQRLPKNWFFNRTGDESYAQVWVTDMRTKEARQVTTPEKEMNYVAPTWNPSGSVLAVEKWLVSMKRESKREEWLVNAANTENGALLFEARRGSGGIEWAPDGRHYTYITSLAVNGKFVNELRTGMVTPEQRAAAAKTTVTVAAKPATGAN